MNRNKQQQQCLNNVTSKIDSPQSDHLISRLYLAKISTLSPNEKQDTGQLLFGKYPYMQ